MIHIAGTKGKGSTSAFADYLLRNIHPDWKVGLSPPSCPPLHIQTVSTGLYTSPHLVSVRERIRVNGVPISEPEFAKYFFEVWDKLQANTGVSVLSVVPLSNLKRPASDISMTHHSCQATFDS